MVTINWKKTALVLTDIVLGGYLILAVTAFNHPDDLTDICGEVRIDIKDDVVKGFLNADEIKLQLQQAKLYPLGYRMDSIDTREIEESLRQSPFVETAECYKTQTGHVNITLTQRLPVMRVKADNGDDYYLDSHGAIMPNTRYVSNLAIATGHVQRKYAQQVLTRVGNLLLQNDVWRSQVEQLNVLSDGSLEMIPRVGNHVVYLGQPVNLGKKLSRLDKFYKYGLSQAGWNKYSYINMEFDNQIICKRRSNKL